MVTGLMEALLVMHLVFYESTALNSPDGSHCLIRAAATNDQRYEGMGENKVC